MMETVQSSSVVELFEDRVFFRKDQIMIGTVLVYYGRRNPGKTWRVMRVRNFKRVNGECVGKWDRFVKGLQDEVELHCEETGDWVYLHFGYLSYSAIWRLA
jgi:hypothetical protein